MPLGDPSLDPFAAKIDEGEVLRWPESTVLDRQKCGSGVVLHLDRVRPYALVLRSPMDPSGRPPTCPGLFSAAFTTRPSSRRKYTYSIPSSLMSFAIAYEDDDEKV